MQDSRKAEIGGFVGVTAFWKQTKENESRPQAADRHDFCGILFKDNASAIGVHGPQDGRIDSVNQMQ